MASNQGTQGQGTSGNIRDRAENVGANVGAAAGRKVGETAGKAQEAASSAAQQARDVASGLGQKAQETASNVAHKAQDVARATTEKTDDAISGLGERMSSLAGTIRENAPREGMVGSAATAFADQLQTGGRYLQEHGLGDMTEELTAVIRRYPMQSLLVGFGVGCLLGMTLSRR